MRVLLVFGDKTFKITIPEDAKVTFGPFSPPPRGPQRGFNEYGAQGEKAGTLRVYGKTQKDVLAVFAGVRGFRDLSIGYAEEVAREEGTVVWKDDKDGYVREEKRVRSEEWREAPALPAHEPTKRKRRG